MKLASKTFLLAAAAISLAACNSNDTKPSDTTKTESAATAVKAPNDDVCNQCATIRSQLNAVDKNAPDAKDQTTALKNKLASLHCSAK